jgi:D-3-phosphoglycerate dehydrogenase
MNSLRAVIRSNGTFSTSSSRRAFLSVFRKFHDSPRNFAKILCCDNIDPICVDIFEQNGHTVDYKSKLSEDELSKVIPNYDGLVVRSGTKVTADILSKASKMKVVGRAGVGIDNIDVPAATKHGILVMNTPGGNTVSTAQLAFSLMCSVARNIPQADMSMKQGLWKRKDYMGTELSGKTIAIVGCGRIGQTFAKWAQALNMKIIGFDPALSVNDASSLGIRLMSLEEIWPLADFITLHTPLTPDTRNLIGKTNIQKMKKGVKIINCARGGIINEADLLEGLNSGQVGGAALDVYEQEPPTGYGLELVAHPKVVCTPHLGASTDEAQINVARDVALQMCATLEGREYVGVVNVDYMEMVNNKLAAPFVSLGEMLGKVAAQYSEKNIESLELQSWGEHGITLSSKQARRMLLAVVLKGVLSVQKSAVEPTIINAPLLAKEQGLKSTVSEKRPMEGSPYTNLVTINVTWKDGQSHILTGSIVGSEPHIVQIDSYKSFPAFKPQGTMLCFRNQDRPGALAEVLEVLKEENVNIGMMALGKQDSNLSLTILDLDSTPSQSCFKKLQASPILQDARLAIIN